MWGPNPHTVQTGVQLQFSHGEGFGQSFLTIAPPLPFLGSIIASTSGKISHQHCADEFVGPCCVQGRYVEHACSCQNPYNPTGRRAFSFLPPTSWSLRLCAGCDAEPVHVYRGTFYLDVAPRGTINTRQEHPRVVHGPFARTSNDARAVPSSIYYLVRRTSHIDLQPFCERAY